MRREERNRVHPAAVVLGAVGVIVMLLGVWISTACGYDGRPGGMDLLVPDRVFAAEAEPAGQTADAGSGESGVAGDQGAAEEDPSPDSGREVSVSVAVSGHGTVNGHDSDYTETLAPGETLVLQIQAEDGYRISDIRINETPLYTSDQESVIGQSSATEELEDLEEDLAVSVEFAEETGDEAGAADGADTAGSEEPPEDGTIDPVVSGEEDGEDGDPDADSGDSDADSIEEGEPGEAEDLGDGDEPYEFNDDPDWEDSDWEDSSWEDSDGEEPVDDFDWEDSEEDSDWEDSEEDFGADEDWEEAAESVARKDTDVNPDREHVGKEQDGQEKAEQTSAKGLGRTEQDETNEAGATDTDKAPEQNRNSFGDETVTATAGGGTQSQTVINQTSGKDAEGKNAGSSGGTDYSPRTGDALPMVCILILLCSLTMLAILVLRERLKREGGLRR